ncbi:NADP-dependent oxidoreductase domain-containing protein [Zychaea mexicana]|uniref:NADP-dependent oxidoreductase domain-containing protein n=1 Tax=Zychaea mexicana TaxID=64656 RepID=UPI0022FEE2DF|nr:NADP-dependent oxidoreductase domain-containing protein [Zychaea mexicana]KAI9470430.1 NADP-dependent oxidoreductase domain-containing protein [Zychaea mexicana]
MSESPVKLSDGVVPTKDTKIVLAGAVKVPPIAIGCWQWGDTTTWSWTPEAEKDAKEAFDTAVELGIPFYDTAEVYGLGESEKEISRFREKYSSGERNKQILATKYFPYPERTQFPDVLLSALRDSLARLGVRKVDLYQVILAMSG